LSLAVAVATMTLARSAREEELLHASLVTLAARGLPVFAADGGSLTGFRERIAAIPGVTLVPYEPGAGPRLIGQVQAAVASAASGRVGYLLYTEPDKGWFFEHRLSRFLESATVHSRSGILAASRNAASFRTFPPGQQLTERLANELCREVLGEDGDYFYGPLLIHGDLVPYLLALQAELGWGWRPYLMAIGLRRGRTIALVEDDLPCPEEQRGEDDPAARIYRMEQMAQNVRGLALGMKVALR
jgi:hypothetical protein